MGKTAIVYYSQHHGNTKKVLDAIANYDKDIDLIDVIEKHEVDLTGYDRIGFDTFSPFKLVGGLQKGHPTEEELQAAVEFYKNL